MAAQKKIKVGIEFDVEKQKLRTLKQQLETIQKMSYIDVMAFTGKGKLEAQKSLQEAAEKARQVQTALQKAYNAKLNTTNIATFTKELGLAGRSLNELRASFAKIGPQGEIAFAKLQNQIFRISKASYQSYNLLNKFGITLFNSIKWTAASSLVQKFTGSIQQAWGFTKSLDSSLNDIRIITGKNADEMARFAEKANLAAKNLGRTTTDYTKASLIFTQQGLSEAEVQARTNVTLKTANVTGQSAETVSEELTAVWNGYKVSAEEAEVYVDRLAAVAATTASNLQELATGMSKVASAAATLGVSEEQLAAQLSTIISVTRQAPQTVGTALKTVYARITDIKAGVEEEGTTLGMYSGKLAEMGINVLDTTGQLKNMGVVIEEVGNKWETFSRQQQVYIAQTMAGQRQYSNLISLFDNFDKYNKAMQTAGNATGTLQKQQDVYMDSARAHINQLTASTEKMWKSMIDSDSMKKLFDFLSGLTNSISWIIDSLGGGGNLLLTLGNIATTVFQKQISSSISTTLYNFDQAKTAALEYRSAIARIDLQISKLGDSEEDNIQRSYFERKKQILQANRNKFLPEEQLNAMNQSVDRLNVIQSTLIATEKTFNSTRQQLQTLFGEIKAGNDVLEQFFNTANKEKSEKFAKNVYDTISSYEFLAKATRDFRPPEAENSSQKILMKDLLTTEIAELEKQQQALKLSLNTIKEPAQRTIIEEQIQGIKQLINTYDELIKSEEKLDVKNQKKLQNSTANNTIKTITQYQSLISALNTSIKKTEILSILPQGAEKTIKNVTLAYNNLISYINNKNFSGAKGTLTGFFNHLQSLADIFPKLKDDIGAFKKALKEALEAQKQLTATQTAYDAELENFQQKISKLNFATIATEISQVASELYQTITVMNQIKSLGNIWGKNNISGGEKFLKTITAISISLTTLIPHIVRNIRQIQLYNAVKNRQAQTTKEVANADIVEAGTKQLVKNASDSATKSAALFMTTVMPWIALISMAIGVLSGLAQSVAQFNEQQKKARTEQNKAAVENINKTLDEIKQQKELYKGLKDLTQQYEQGTLSKNNLKEKTIELCKEYNLQSDRIKGLIGDYGKLSDAILQAEKLANKEAIKNETSKRNIALQELLSNQAYQKKGSQYVIEIQTKDISGSEKDFYESMGWTLKDGKVFLKADYYDQEAVSKVVQTAFKTYQQAAGQGFTNSNLYYWLKEFVNYAKEHMAEDIIAAQQQIEQQNLYNIILKTFGTGVKTQQEYTQAYEKAIEQANKIFPNMTQEQLSKNIEKILLDKYSDAYMQYQNITDLKNKFNHIKDLTLEKLLDFSDITLEDLKLITPQDYNSVQEVLQLFKKIYEYKNLISGTSINSQESVELYNNYQTALEKVQSGKKLGKKEFQALELDNEEKNNFIQLPNGEFEYQGNPKDFENLIKNKLLNIFISDSNLLKKKIELETKKSKQSYQQISYETKSIQELISRSGQQLSLSSEIDELKKIQEMPTGIQRGFSTSGWGLTESAKQKVLEKVRYAYDTAKQYYGKDWENSLVKDFLDDQKYDLLTLQALQRFLSTFSGTFPEEKTQTAFDAVIGTIAVNKGLSFEEVKNNGKILQEELGIGNEQIKEKIEELLNTEYGAEIGKEKLQKYLQQLNKGTFTDYYDVLSMYDSYSSSDFGEGAKNKAEEAKKELNIKHKSSYDTIFKTDSDLTDTNIYKLLNVLRQSVEFSEELSNNLKDDQTALKDLSKVALRFDNGVQDIVKNIGAWEDAIQNDSYLSIAQMKDAYADVLNVQENILTTDFLMNKKNLQLLKDAIVNQNEESYIKLRDNLEKTFNLQNLDNGILQQIEDIKIKATDASKKIGEQITVDSVDAILKALYQQNLSIQQVTALFENWGINIHLVPIIDENKDITGFEQQAGTKITKAANFDWLSKMLSSSALSAIDSANKRINKETQLTKLLDKEVDIYHDINIELNVIDKKLSRLQKIQKNLSGAELLNNLQKQTKVLAEQNQKLKEKQQLQKQDLIKQSSILKGLGATFNTDGSIANYSSLYGSAINSVNNIIEQIRAKEESAYGMDTSSTAYKQIEDEIKELKREQNKRQQHLDRVEKYISKYDSTRSSLFDLVDKIEDSARSAIELNLQIFQTKVKIKLDLTQAQKDWDHFVSETLNRDDIFNPSAFKSRQKTVELAFKDIKYFDENYKNLSEQLARYQKETRRFQQARMSGIEYQSELFNSESEALAAAEQTSKQMQQAITSYADSMDAIKQAILDAYEDVSEIFSKNNDIYSFIKNQLNHDIQLIDLLEGGRGGRLKDSLYVQTNQFNMDNIKQLKAQVDYWANENAKATDEATRKLTKQKWKQTIESLNSATEEGIQNLKSKYENLIDTISKEMQDKLTGGFGFDYFTTEWDRVKERANSYLDPINAAFAIKDTQLNYRKVINDTSSLLNQQKLTKVMNEQLNILKQKDKLTQYDVDRANKILEIEKARMALEDARNNKTTLRLKRDSQGNYSYQFTADQTAIEEAQNKLDKAKNDLYNLDLKAYQDNADKVVKLTQDTQKKISEIMKDQNLSEKQRKQALLELQRSYQEQLTFLTKQNTSIRNNLMQSTTDAMSDSFNKGKIDFENMIDGWNSGIQKWINDLAKNPDSAFEIMKMGIQEMIQASESFKDKSGEYLGAAGDGYKTLKRIGIDPLVESENKAVTKVDDLITKINEITGTAQTWRTGLGTVASGFDAIKDSANSAGNAILKFKRALASNGQENNKGNGTGVTQYGNSVSGSGTSLQSNFVNVPKISAQPQLTDKSKQDSSFNKTNQTGIDMSGLIKGESIKKESSDSTKVDFFKTLYEIPYEFEKNKKQQTQSSQTKTGWWIMDEFEKNKKLKNIYNYDALVKAGISQEQALQRVILNLETNPLPGPTYEPAGYSSSEIFKSQVGFLKSATQALNTLQKSDKERDGKYSESDFKKIFPNLNYILYSTAWENVKTIMNKVKNSKALPPLTYEQWTKGKYVDIIKNKIGMKYDTGGYTGSWNSTKGKLAILHEKELILNKDDTKNMLKMLKITRDNQNQSLDYLSIFNTIANNLMTIVKEITLAKMQNDFSTITDLQSDMLKYKTQVNNTAKEIEQQVKIEANFPNVNSKEEIEAALSDLVNMAAQRALKINKN